MPIAGNGSGYAGGGCIVELDSAAAGWVSSVEGGHATADVVADPPGPDLVVRKHLAGVKYEDITVNCGTSMSAAFYDWLASTFNRAYQRKNGAIVVTDYNFNELSRLDFSNALITEIGFPPCDASSKDPGYLTIKFSPECTRYTKGSGKAVTGGSPAPAAPKSWLPSNFRLQIDGLDCSRVNTIEAITLRQALVENAVGERRSAEIQPASQDVSNLVVTLPEANADDFYAWHEDFVINGNNGPDKEKNGTLEYLAPNLQQVLFSLTLSHLGIFRLTPEKVEAGSENIRRVCAEMYCDEMTFAYPGAAASLVGRAASVTAQPALLPPSALEPATVARAAFGLRFRA